MLDVVMMAVVAAAAVAAVAAVAVVAVFRLQAHGTMETTRTRA
jgi:hypothetical protein